MLEREIEKHLVRTVREHGGEVRKVKWIGRHSAPDRLVLLPLQHFLVELKRPGKGATANQAREHKRLRAAGFTVIVINHKADIDTLFINVPFHGGKHFDFR